MRVCNAEGEPEVKLSCLVPLVRRVRAAVASHIHLRGFLNVNPFNRIGDNGAV